MSDELPVTGAQCRDIEKPLLPSGGSAWEGDVRHCPTPTAVVREEALRQVPTGSSLAGADTGYIQVVVKCFSEC